MIIIFLLIVAAVVWFILHKMKNFYKSHEFVIKCLICCPIISFLPSVIFNNETAFYVSLIVCAAIYVLIKLIYKNDANRFYNENRYTVNSVFLSFIFITILTSLFENAKVGIIGIILAIIFIAAIRITYKSRVESYISEYIYNMTNNSDNTRVITEEDLFSQPRSKQLLRQGHVIQGMTPLNFMKTVLRNNVILKIKKTFLKGLDESSNRSIGRIFFYYEYTYYLDYLKEQGIPLIDCIESFGIVDSRYLYIEDVAFFSESLMMDVVQQFDKLISDIPKLSDVPFSEEYLFENACQYGLLNNYVREFDLNGLRDNPDYFQDDFIGLYSGITNGVLQIGKENGRITEQPDVQNKDEYLYSLNHSDENGIIKEEYGQQFEQHRDSVDVDSTADQLSMLDCPV